MSPEETRAWAHDPDWELSDQDEDHALLVHCDWAVLVDCAADTSCPKAEFIEAALAVAVTEMVRSHRGSDRIEAIKAQIAGPQVGNLRRLREALRLYDLWKFPRPLGGDECDQLAKSLLLWVDHPLTKFSRTGHEFDGFIEYSKHNSSAGLVF